MRPPESETPRTRLASADERLGADEYSFKHIHAFLTVARHRSITKAAKELHLTQSGLSRIINLLEKDLGESLFDRALTGLDLTVFGMAFMPHAEDLHQHYLDAFSAAQARRTKGFTVAGCQSLMPAVSALLLDSDVKTLSQDGSLEIYSFWNHQVPEEVISGRADVGLCMYDCALDGLLAIPLLSAPLLMVTREGHQRFHRSAYPDEQLRLPMLRLAEPFELPKFLRSHHLLIEAYQDSKYLFNDLRTLCAALVHTDFLTIMSALDWSLIPTSGLTYRPLPKPYPAMTLCLLLRSGQVLTAHQSAYVQALIESVQRLAWLPCVDVLPARLAQG